MSGDRSTPRFDVVATTRRSWSNEQKRAMVAEIGIDDATLSQVARRHGVHASLLFRWRRDLGAAPAAVTREAPRPQPAVSPAAPPPRPALSFVPVTLPPPPPPPPPPAPKPAPRSGVIEIVLAGGRTVRVGADVDTAALVRIVAALEAETNRGETGRKRPARAALP